MLPDGEQFKNLDTLQSIFDTLLESRCSRTTTLIALGGGVIGDVVGFAAACYQREFLHSTANDTAGASGFSVGGKTAVNHPQGKT